MSPDIGEKRFHVEILLETILGSISKTWYPRIGYQNLSQYLTVTDAMLKMQKIIVADLQKACDG